MTVPEIDVHSINTIRVLAADIVAKAKAGHPGTAMGCAPMAHVLFSKFLQISPENHTWLNRDRFVLSNGHSCVLQYIIWHLLGFNISMDDLKSYLKLDSKTAGHPEANDNVHGIEVSTGPLGQGISNAVGLTLAQAQMAATFNKPGFSIFDNYTYCILGDGCMQEGVQSEAVSLAGHWKLGKLIALYDDNHVTIDGDTALGFTEDVVKRFEAYGWHTIVVSDGDNDVEAIADAIQQAKDVADKPSLIKIRTTIGFGSVNEGTEKVHGSPMEKEDIAKIKEKFDFNPNEDFVIPNEVALFWRDIMARNNDAAVKWTQLFEGYSKKYPELAREIVRRKDHKLPSNLRELLPTFKSSDPEEATRTSSKKVLSAIADSLPELIGGSADLAGSNQTMWPTARKFQHPSTKLGDYSGRYIHFGIREHGMTAICNGIAAYGPFIPFCATFLNFISYAMGAVRLAAFSDHHVLFVLTHDSIGLGEDGPTHQPVETLAFLRAIPNFVTIRPCDGNEVSGAYLAALQSTGPVGIILSRQKLPQLEGTSIDQVLKGAYILSQVDKPNVILVASGSEVNLIATAQEQLEKENINANVVTMPSWELFEMQSSEYRKSILLDGVPAVSVEALTTLGWKKYAHSNLGVDSFGMSGPGVEIFDAKGVTVDAIIARTKKVLSYFKNHVAGNKICDELA